MRVGLGVANDSRDCTKTHSKDFLSGFVVALTLAASVVIPPFAPA